MASGVGIINYPVMHRTVLSPPFWRATALRKQRHVRLLKSSIARVVRSFDSSLNILRVLQPAILHSLCANLVGVWAVLQNSTTYVTKLAIATVRTSCVLEETMKALERFARASL